MARTKRWIDVHPPEYGMWEIKLTSWRYFHDFVHQQMLDFSHFIWRGQRCDNRLLESSLDRQLRGLSPQKKEETIKTHLDTFKYAVRGRRGANPVLLLSENDWWALGQHHGLSTPLLDWTTSPFVALYFAFERIKAPQTNHRAVFALSRKTINHFSTNIAKKHAGTERPPIIEFIQPLADDNPRLVNQSGLFSRAPYGVCIEDWFKTNIPKDRTFGTYIKILIPNKDRDACLKTLNRMNINHLTLFPDLYGASHYCNMSLGIDKYCY